MTPQEKPESTKTEQASFGPGQNFLIGFLLSGVPIFIFLSMSVDMTYGNLAAVEPEKLAGAVIVPTLCGLLAVFLKDRFISFLSSLLESLNVPF